MNRAAPVRTVSGRPEVPTPPPLTSPPPAPSPPASPPLTPPPLSGDPILRRVTRVSFALIMLLAFLLLWRGHNAPGGGFIAGLMTVAALLLHRMTHGESALKVQPLRLIPWGLALSFVTGLVPYLLGRPFLKSAFGYLSTPVTGEFEWTSALLFDLGVFLVVVGSGLSVAYALIDVQPDELVDGDGEEQGG